MADFHPNSIIPESLPVNILQSRLKSFKINHNGRKAVLQVRLTIAELGLQQPVNDVEKELVSYFHYQAPELRELCDEKGIPSDGTIAHMRRALVWDIAQPEAETTAERHLTPEETIVNNSNVGGGEASGTRSSTSKARRSVLPEGSPLRSNNHGSKTPSGLHVSPLPKIKKEKKDTENNRIKEEVPSSSIFTLKQGRSKQHGDGNNKTPKSKSTSKNASKRSQFVSLSDMQSELDSMVDGSSSRR